MVVAPIVALVIAANVGDALAPSLVPDPDKPGSGHPLLLIALNARNRNLLAVANHLDAWSYYIVGTLRLLAADPPFYFLGYFYGDNAVKWIEGKSPTMGRYARQFEGVFAKASYPLVFVMPNNFICLFAGAAGMRPAWFISLNVTGTIVRLYLLRVLGEVFAEPIDSVLGWVADNRLWLTGVTVGLVAFSMLADRRKGAGDLAGITDLADEPEPDPSAPAAAPADEQPPPGDPVEGGGMPWLWKVGIGLLVAGLAAAAAWALVRDDSDADERQSPPASSAPAATPDASVLTAPSRSDVRLLGARGCEAWIDDATEVSCATFDGDGDGRADSAWLVSRTDDGWRAEVLRRADEQRWNVALAAGPDPTWSFVGAATADLGGGAGEELAVGFHLPGSGSLLVVEVVDATGVVVHGDLDHGAAELTPQGLVTYEAQFLPDDAGCCPSELRRSRITEVDGVWQVVEATTVAPAPPPTSQI